MQQRNSNRRHLDISARWFVSVILALTVSATGWGAHPWFSSRTAGNQSRPVAARPLSSSALQAIQEAKGPATLTNGIFDIVINLYNDPKGDDDGNTQGKTGSEEQDAYEYIIKYLADGVYESTEGKHSLGTVRLYRNGKQPAADVVWKQSGEPSTDGHLNTSGEAAIIEMYDIYPQPDLTLIVYTNPAHFEDGGYTLAHEWGHYAYGLADEYCYMPSLGTFARLDETNRVKPSIMNNAWNAHNRNYEWLNFSIPWQGHTRDADYARYENRRQSAHHQFYEQSVWETLVTDPAKDPNNNAFQDFWAIHFGTRVRYPELVAPVGKDAPRINLSTTADLDSLPSRDNLNIVWMSSNLAVELIIDCSGSMSEDIGSANKYEYAKAAAKSLLDQAPTGMAFGVVAFATTVNVQRAVTVISNEATRAQLKAAVDNIQPPYFEGQTALGDAAATGLAELLAFTGSNITRVAFIISDGEYNYGRDPAEVIPDYKRARVPIMGAAIGELTDNLQIMAAETGGRCYLSADGHLASLDSALRDMLNLAAARQSLGRGRRTHNNGGSHLREPGGRAETSESYSIPFRVDSTLSDLKVSVVFSNAVTVALQRPDGAVCLAAFTNHVGIETQLFYQVSAPDAGDWKITGTLDTNASLSYTVDAGMNSMTYNLRGWSQLSPNVNYLHFPYPFEINAYLNNGRAINGAVVTASIKSPYSDTPVNITLNSAGRGHYLGVLPNPVWADYEVTVRADNSAGTAYMTSEGNLPVCLPDGSVPPRDPDTPIAENFVRTDTYTIEVVGCAENEDPPKAPIQPSATAGLFNNAVRLRWFDINLNFRHIAQYFEIWRSTDPQLAGAIKAASVAYPRNQYFDTNVTPGTVYYYGIRAINPIHNSAFAPTCMGFAAGADSSSPWLPLAADFDGDGRADPALYQPATGAWKVWLSGAGFAPLVLPAGFMGGNNYDAVAADFDGDGKADPAVCDRSTGDWSVRFSSQGYAASTFPGLMGGSAWTTLAGDWDGDRLADPTAYCDATGTLWARLSSAGYASFQADQIFYSGAGLSPLGADFDGDGYGDPGFCEIPMAYWEIHLTSATLYGISIAQLWDFLGYAGWLPVAADFDGDRKADMGVYNAGSGEWQVSLSAYGYAKVSVFLP